MTDEIALQEIEYRKRLMEKQNWTEEERAWSLTHAIYSESFGYPYLQLAMEHVIPSQTYLLRVKKEKEQYTTTGVMIHVPIKKGHILTEFEVINHRGKKSRQKPISYLYIDSKVDETIEFTFVSELGLLEVEYASLMKKWGATITASSSSDDALAMRREQIAENKVRYHCTAEGHKMFDALVFTVEWIPIEATQ